MENKEVAQAGEPIIKIEGVNKYYEYGKRDTAALLDINLEIYAHDYAIIYGPSGCGKSTLLNIVAGVEELSSGKVLVRGKNLFEMDEDGRGLFRSKKMGIIYQMPYWIKSLNVRENVALPLIIEGIKEKAAVKRAQNLLEELEIDKFSHQLPTELSGGEQQKVSFARALISNPFIIIADEPTGNLDSKSADEIMNLFSKMNKESKKTILLVTHNPNYWNAGNKKVELKDGRIIKEENNG